MNSFVSNLNSVHDNVWALVIMGGGIVLTCCHQVGAGGTLITLGAAVFQKSPRPESKP